MHKFMIDNCNIVCRTDGDALTRDGERTEFAAAAYFGVSDRGVLLQADGKEYSCPLSLVTAMRLEKRRRGKDPDRLTLFSGESVLLTAENAGHKRKFRLLYYIFDYIAAVGFLTDEKAGTAERLIRADGGRKTFDGLTGMYYAARTGELADANTGKRITGRCRLTADGGFTAAFEDGRSIALPLADVRCVIFDKNRRFDRAVLSFCSKSHTGLLFGVIADNADDARALESAVTETLGDAFRLDRRTNNLFHPKEEKKRRK